MNSVARRRGPLVAVALMFLLSVMSYFDRTIMSIAGPSVMREFGISPTQMGTIYSSFLLSYTVLMLFGGVLADRYGARLVLAVSAAGSALATALTTLGSTVLSFAAVRLLFGAFTAPLYPACGRMVARLLPPGRHARAQGTIIAGAAVGASLSPVLFTSLLERFGWRVSFLLAALATLVITMIWLLAAPRTAPRSAQAAQSHSASWIPLLRDRRLILLTGAYFMVNYFEYIFFYWIYYYFEEVRRFGTHASAIATTCLFVTMAVMTPLGGWVSDRLSVRHGARFGRRLVVLAGLGGSSVLLCLAALGFGPVASTALLSGALGLCSAAEGPFWAAAMEIAASNVGASCGFMNAGGNVGGILAPVLTPLAAGKFGWAGGLYLGSAAAGMAAVLWLFIGFGKRHEASPAGLEAEAGLFP